MDLVLQIRQGSDGCGTEGTAWFTSTGGSAPEEPPGANAGVLIAGLVGWRAACGAGSGQPGPTRAAGQAASPEAHEAAWRPATRSRGEEMFGRARLCAGRTARDVSAISNGDVGAAACDKGPMQRTGAKVDRATGQDKVIGAGPLERAGRNVDQAVKDLKE